MEYYSARISCLNIEELYIVVQIAFMKDVDCYDWMGRVFYHLLSLVAKNIRNPNRNA